MKRILFYIVLVLQVGIIAVLGWQYTLIDHYGKSVDLLLDRNNHSFPEYVDYQGYVYLDYEINRITEADEKIDATVDNNQKVYVLLEADQDGVYHVEKVSINKMDANYNQIVFSGKYDYYGSMSGLDRVNYGIERVRDQDLYQDLKNKQMIATVKVAPWGQKKVVAIESAVDE